MNLYLIRHADAGDRDRWAGDDADRPLSDLGRAQARALGEAFRRQAVDVGTVVASPLARANQTAEEFVAGFGDHRNILLTEFLVPGEFRRRKLLAYLTALNLPDLAVVGHNPDLSAYAGWLTGLGAGAVDLEKGGAALVTFDAEPGKGGGRLGWVVGPGWYMPAEGPAAAGSTGLVVGNGREHARR